jgi:transcriptional regulator with XRE-family HTH domain
MTSADRPDRLFDWRVAMRDYRRRLRLSLAEVARRSGLSLSAVKSYENGTRHPTRAALKAVTDALGMTAEQSNPIFAGAGYATNWRAIYHEAYGPRPVEWFAEEVERSFWPVLVTNEASDIIAANRAVRRIIGIPEAQGLPHTDYNFLAWGSDPEWAKHLESWDEAMMFVLGLAKGLRGRHSTPETPTPWTVDAYKRFLKGDPALITRMLKLWEPSAPLPQTTRMHYPVRWRDDKGRLLQFTAISTVADVYQVFAWHDWVPDDAETLRILQSLI